jgi:uncharacterized protein GlcG (DUF336 family)
MPLLIFGPKKETNMKHGIYIVIFFLVITSTEAFADQPYVQMRALSAELANQLAFTAAEECRKHGYQVAVAVVDRSGNLMAFVRDPLAGPHTIDVSQRKAYTAATYQTSTAQMADNQYLRFTPGVILLGGGLPIRAGGQFYGAVGVSGAPAKKIPGDEDEACAQAGIDAIREALEFTD